MTIILDQTRERFLLAIAAQVDPARIAEIHFFAPIKQGGTESGVAVIAANAAPANAAPAEAAEAMQPSPAGADGSSAADADADADPAAEPRAPRHVIYTARYRLTLKGPDRGKWETNVVAEADAPLVTLDAVVRGVQQRAGDVDEATRIDGDDIRAALDARAAATAATTAAAAGSAPIPHSTA